MRIALIIMTPITIMMMKDGSNSNDADDDDDDHAISALEGPYWLTWAVGSGIPERVWS